MTSAGHRIPQHSVYDSDWGRFWSTPVTGSTIIHASLDGYFFCKDYCDSWFNIVDIIEKNILSCGHTYLIAVRNSFPTSCFTLGDARLHTAAG